MPSPSPEALPDQTACTVWTCQIGVVGNLRHLLPHGSDEPMRDAVEARFARVLGIPAEFVFSGWGDPLPESYLAVVENREPVYELTDYAKEKEHERLASEVERLRMQLVRSNECVRIYVQHRERGLDLRPGWLEEEVAATDELLNDLAPASDENLTTKKGGADAR